jgi:xanthine/uracil permease
MAKIDEIKEILNTLRIAMSIAFGILIVVTGSMIKRYDENNIDDIFWIGIGFSSLVILFIFFIINKISKKTKEIKDL